MVESSFTALGKYTLSNLIVHDLILWYLVTVSGRKVNVYVGVSTRKSPPLKPPFACFKCMIMPIKQEKTEVGQI